MELGRFAPSPSGRMHLGNVFSALMAWLSAKSQGGEIILRIEDLDPDRSKLEYAQAIRRDFQWLGLTWEREATPQSQRSTVYDRLLATLDTYPCYCSRDQLHAASAPHATDGRVIYAGTCRTLTPAQRASKVRAPSLRIRVPKQTISFTDGLQGMQSMDLQQEWGDFILRRSDGVAAYQLAVVADDGEAGVTQVVRGRDLLTSTPPQLSRYELLDLTPPLFYHVPMLLSPSGCRLSKRDRALDLGILQLYHTPEEILGFLAYICGLLPKQEKISARELLSVFSWEKVQREDIVLSGQFLQMS